MRQLFLLIATAGLLATGVSEAASLNKCIDAQGKVTYSNLPCHNAREARTVEVDPAPLPDPVRSTPVRAQPAKAASTKPAASSEPPATIQLETRRTSGKPVARTSARQCDAITDKLGRVLDKMDQARHSGYTQKQVDEWNQEIRDLERKKQQSGCF